MTRPDPAPAAWLGGLLPLLLALLLSCERIEPLRAGDGGGGESVQLTCAGCHTNQTYLALLAPDTDTQDGPLPPLEDWRKVLLASADFDPNHAALGCVTCHGGSEPVTAAGAGRQELWLAMAEAHEFTAARGAGGEVLYTRPATQGMQRDPSLTPEQNCNGAGCHAPIVEASASSLHRQLWGEKHKVALRAGFGSWEECPELLKNGFRADCASCHATCGQCHVSRPLSAGGGLLDSHLFQRRPGTESTCEACHARTVGADWGGHIAGNMPDVHNEGGLGCLDCHHENLHGDGRTDYTTRYAVEGQPRCVDCHAGASDANLYHQYHWPEGSIVAGLACTVCHSQPYNNCFNCHAGGSVDGEVVDFRIGHRGDLRPGHSGHEEWVTVRHAPISPDSFQPWGWPVLENWAALESWEVASPHNIRRFTPQTAVALANPAYSMGDCWMSCHAQGPQEEGNARRFLWLSHLDSLKTSITGLADPEDYVRANRRVAVDDSLSRYWNRH